jgi:hypothetical protein
LIKNYNINSIILPTIIILFTINNKSIKTLDILFYNNMNNIFISIRYIKFQNENENENENENQIQTIE